MSNRKAVCCLCHEEKTWHEFTSYFNHCYLLKDGSRICIYCKECEKNFFALECGLQEEYAHRACEQTFPPNQIIYVERDPRSQEPRYIGRTHNADRRHAEHVRHATAFLGGFYQGALGEMIPVPYTRKHWIYDLKQLGLKPIQEILMCIDIAPQVMEWETRWILHAIQQNWPILNKETAASEHVKRVGAIDFLHVPFKDLVEGKFIMDQGIEVFVRKWYKP